MSVSTENTLFFGSTINTSTTNINTIIFGGYTTPFSPTTSTLNTIIFGSCVYVPPIPASTVGTIIYNNAGSAITQIWVEHISEVKKQRIAVHDLPTANKDIIQTFGTKNRLFTLQGFVTGSNGIDSLRSLPGTTGSIFHASDLGTTFLPRTHVLYCNVGFEDRAGKPFVRNFTIEAVEVI